MIRSNLKLIAFTFALVLFGACPVFVHSATLTAPERADAGRLQKVTSDVQGDWLIYPPDAADLAKDSDEKTLYFVGRRDCELTVIFFGVEKSKPVITQTTVIIGPVPEPTPEPSPAPVPVVTLSDREKAAAGLALNTVIMEIEDGTITTPAGARSTFKQVLMKTGQVCNGRKCYLPENLVKLADDWTNRTDFSTLEGIKNSFEGFLKEVE